MTNKLKCIHTENDLEYLDYKDGEVRISINNVDRFEKIRISVYVKKVDLLKLIK